MASGDRLEALRSMALGRAVDAPVSWIGPDEVEGYVVHMRERGLSESSIKNRPFVIRSFFDTLCERLDLPDPTKRLDEGDHAVFSSMIFAGLRIEETTALPVDDLSVSRGAEEVRVAKGKGNKERLVPMGPRLRHSPRRYLRARDALILANIAPLPHLFVTEKGSRVTEGTLKRRLFGWVRESRLEKADTEPHDLRRTFGTWYPQRRTSAS